MASLMRNFVERRVPHSVALYIDVSWGCVQFTQFIVNEFVLSPHWTRVVLSMVLLFLPTVLMLAWFHGKPGRNRVTLTEKVGIPVNLAVAAVVLALAFSGTDLGAAVERAIPKAEFRKRTALFPFDAGSGLGEDGSWVSYLTPRALTLDLMPDDFFEPLSGSLPRYAGPDLLALVDEMSVDLKAALEIPSREGVDDLPVRERLSPDVSAVESYGRFREAEVVRSDWSAGIDHLNTATRNDPTFALAQLDLALLLVSNNRPQEAAAAIRAALDHVYRLPERLQFIVKANYYGFAGDVPRAMALLEMWADLYPEDPLALGNLVGALTNRGDWEGVLETLRRMYALDPRGEMAQAIAAMDARVSEASTFRSTVEIAVSRVEDVNTYIAAGRRDAAGALFDDLRSRIPMPYAEIVVPHMELHIEIAEANFDAARDAHARWSQAVEEFDFEVFRTDLIWHRGLINQAAEDHASAFADYRTAREMDLDPASYYHDSERVGTVLRELGRLDEAQSNLEEVLRLTPAALPVPSPP